MVRILRNAAVACAVAGAVNAATPEQWRSRSIFQVLTDRYVVMPLGHKNAFS